MCAWLVCLRASGCSKCLRTDCFLLTCWLKPNHVFPGGQVLIISPQSQVLDSNNQHGADNNNHFTAKESEKARHIGLPTKVIAIYIGKKAGHYYQNNDQDNKSLPVRLNQ